MAKLTLSSPVLYVLNRLQQAGYDAYVVGGAVRDILMGRPTTDWDFTTNATPEQIMKVFKHRFYDNTFGTVGLPGKKEKEAFLHPEDPEAINPDSVGIDTKQLNQALTLIRTAIDQHVPILIYGDYDADGITATAILWEALHDLGVKAVPFIPSRELHGYGLSVKGLEDALKLIPHTGSGDAPLVITVDNGIVAHDAVRWLKDRDIQVIITDHHQPGDSQAGGPTADALVHTTELCGAGVAWLLAKELNPGHVMQSLDLVCIGTVADMMPLTGANRSLVSSGLRAVRETRRAGLKALFTEAGIDLTEPVTPYHINFVVAPRLNAMGRLEHAMDSLRLLCTNNEERAQLLAKTLKDTNQNRQDLTQELLFHAKNRVGTAVTDRIIVIDHETYHEGVIGLIAGKLVETYYRPAIVISRKEGVSKASARSVKGVNITELIRSQSHMLLGVGGHPMAAGFSIETEKIAAFKDSLMKYSESIVTDDLLEPHLAVDCEITMEDITDDLYNLIQSLQPFGIGNPQPVFAVNDAPVLTAQVIGKTGQHLKLQLKRDQNVPLEALWFGHGSDAKTLGLKRVNLAFTIDRNTWRNKMTLQLMVKDVQV